MANDKLLIAMINFLVPFILLYAFFVLVDYSVSGFSALIYTAILLTISFVIYSLKFSTPLKFADLKLPTFISIATISKIAISMILIYLTAILLLLVGN